MFVVSADDIKAHLSYNDCISVMRAAMARLSGGTTEQMLRQILPLDEGRMFGIMAGTMGTSAAFGSKLICVTPHSAQNDIPSHQGVVVVFDPRTGAPACIAEAGEITSRRTASASAMATDVLAREDSKVLAILGTGEQALHHARALPEVRDLDEIRIWGRTPEKASALAAKVEDEMGIRATAHHDVEQAVGVADIICTVTSSDLPVLLADMVKPGTHVNVVGSSFDGPREVDDALVSRSRYFADSRPSVEAQGSEYRHALVSGAIQASHLLGEIGEVLLSKVDGRTSDADITIYKSLGHIIQDIAAAGHVWMSMSQEPG